MAQISKCLKLISKLDERDQDALIARLDELQAQGVPAARAQIQAAIDVLTAVQREEAPVVRSAARPEAVVDDDGDMPGAKYAEFPGDAYMRFGQDSRGRIRLQSMASSESVRGRDMLKWLGDEYNRPVLVDEVTDTASGFWERMQSEGLINGWSEKRFTGKTVPVSEGEAVRSATRAPAGVEIVEVEDGFDAMKDGKRIGRLRDNLPRGAAEQLDENASVDIVKVEPEFKGQGVGGALYDAFAEKHGGRITPSGKTSPEAWALWKRKFPEKVDEFVAAEAGRIADGADQAMVVRNISDPEVARRVAEAAPEQVLRSASRQTETPEFKAWFKDSKVVDADGEPMVVYHGTPAREDFSSFAKWPNFFTPDASYANRFGDISGGRVMPVYLSIQNPLDARELGSRPISTDRVLNFMAASGVTLPDEFERSLRNDNGKDEWWYHFRTGAEFQGAIQRAGYDGMIQRESHSGQETDAYVTFKPEQVKSATGNRGTFDSADANITRSASRPEFFSQLQRSIEQVPDRLATMAAPQWKLWLDANAPKLGVKKDEIEWSGVKDYLDLRGKDKVTRDELVAFLGDNGVRVEETVLGSTGLRDTGEMYVGEANDYGDEWAVFTEDGSIIGGTYESQGAAEQAMDQMNTEGKPTKYGGYTVPGGENYREVLITLPVPKKQTGWRFKPRDGSRGFTMGMGDDEETRAIRANTYKADVEPIFEDQKAGTYKSSHWDQPNILAHLRVDDRTDADGNKVLFINEIQSDWGQDGKKKGFMDGRIAKPLSREEDDELMRLFDSRSRTPEETRRMHELNDRMNAVDKRDGKLGVPNAPFVTDTKAWAGLALKRAIMMAVEGGYDRVALITGEQAADLYDLRKRVSKIEYEPISADDGVEGTFEVMVYGTDGKEIFHEDEIGLDRVEEVLGKEVAQKMQAREGDKSRGGYRDWHTLAGDDLQFGGQGMRTFYDQIIPQVARDVLKKLGGGSLGKATLSHDPNIELSKWEPEDGEGDGSKAAVETWESPAFDITPAMRDKVASGVPLFSKGRTATGADWESPSASKFDELVYKFQDKQIDTKRVVEAIKAAGGAIRDDLNVYLNEELYHGRAAKRTEDFVNMELNPLVEDMAKAGMTIADLEEFLHARHAKEANAVIAQRNPGEPSLQDGGSGMTNAEADNYMATLPADDRKKLEAAAAKVDAIIGGTRQMFVDYELESQNTVNGWNGLFKHYVPLQREDKEGSPGLGQGFSIKGKETKGRTGSTRKVVDILANIAMQRERAIVRGEKNRVAQALVGLVRDNENPDFWLVDEVPTERVFNPATGLVEDKVDPMYKSRDNAVVAKIKDPSGAVREHAVLFNEDDPRALRMAQALKNLDAQELNGLLGASAKVTRYFAAVNTQYNPVFGVVNLVRDVQGAMLNLTATPLKDDKAKIAKYTASALAGIYGDMRAARKGKSPASKWASLWDEFQEVGGQTGYRDLFATSKDRADAIQKALDPTAWMDSPLGKVFTAGGTLKVPLAQAQKQAGFIFDWLSDYNGAMENGVRLAAYKAGLERGLSKEQAASVAKNLTTNFNRKGQVAQQAGAMYAFFNAAIQGTARIGQTLFDMEPGKPKTLRLSATGKKIVLGGIALGSIQALALAAAGFNEEDPPEFARERSLIIPTGGKTYVAIPMPLGMHIIPNIGRVGTEFVLSGFKDPIKRSIGLTAMFADAFNPIGNAGMSMQTLAPTALDPLVALTENKDWTGRPIAKTSFNKATPGHALGRDTSTAIGEVLSEAINTLSGGNKYVAGVFSPTPDQIDYLWGQVTGGVGREYSKTEQTLKSIIRGENLPTYKIPLVGRFVGNAKGQASEGSAFYANVDKLNELETEVKGLRADGKDAEAKAILASRPDSYLIAQANYAERQAQKLRRQKSDLVKAGAPREQVKAVEEQITEVMARFNRAAESLRDRATAAQ